MGNEESKEFNERSQERASNWRGAALERGKDLVIFFLARGRPNTVLNRRLPGITARDVLSRVAFGFFLSLNLPINLSRLETFPGAACLKQFAAIYAPRQISRSLSVTIQSGSPPGASAGLIAPRQAGQGFELLPRILQRKRGRS